MMAFARIATKHVRATKITTIFLTSLSSEFAYSYFKMGAKVLKWKKYLKRSVNSDGYKILEVN